MNTRDYGNEIDAIRTDLGALRGDIGRLLDAAGRSASERVRSGAERARASADAAVEKGRQGAAVIGQQIEDHPIATICTALGVGIVIGRIMDRNGSR